MRLRRLTTLVLLFCFSGFAYSQVIDTDSDGVVDTSDAFPTDPAASIDSDGDGQPDQWNLFKAAIDSTSTPALTLDDDDDNDGTPDFQDDLPLNPNETRDWDGDGLGDNEDADDDNDGVPDSEDAFPLDPVNDTDTDGDGVGDTWDAAPNDASIQSVSISEALDNVPDASLYDCLQEAANSFSSAAELTGLSCQDFDNYDIRDLTGLNQFYNLTSIGLDTGCPDSLAGIDSLSQLEEFYCSNRGSPLTDLSPFAAHYNLKRLAVQEVDNLTGAAFESLSALKRMEYMAFTSIDSIEFLRHFPKLTYFLIARSQVTDFTPIAQLEFLESIYIYGQDASSISDFSIVRGMPNLWRLAIAGTAVTKLSDIAHLTALRVVGLDSNMISDISGIKPLSELESLDLRYNEIETIGNTFDAWANGTVISLDGNPLPCTVVDAAKSHTNITVVFDSECVPDDSDDDGIPDAEDAFPDDPAASVDSDGDGYPDVWNDVATSDQIAASNLRLDAFPDDKFEHTDADGDGIGNSVDVSDTDASIGYQSFSAAIEGINDPALQTCLVNQHPNASSIADIRDINCPYPESDSDRVTNLAGLDSFKLVTHLSLDSGAFTNIEPVSSLKRLQYLYMSNGRNGDQYSDIAPLSGLSDLEHVELDHWGYNKSAVDSWPKLRTLVLHDQQLSVLPDFSSNPALTTLIMARGNLEDLTSLAAIPQLETLQLWDNQIVDISPLSGLPVLGELRLTNNRITDISPLASFADRSPFLVLNDNTITDISIFKSFSSGLIDLFGNPISCADLSETRALSGAEIRFDDASCIDLQAGLVLHLPFDGNAVDIVGDSEGLNPATLNSDSNFGDGVVGQGLFGQAAVLPDQMPLGLTPPIVLV